MTKLTSITVVLIILSGCASLADFQKMNVSQRANYICNEHDGVERLEREGRRYTKLANEIQTVISRGYRLHKSCKRVRVEKPSGNIDCDTFGSHTTCTQPTTTSYEKQCTETPVPIDYEGERSKYRGYSSASARALQRRSEVYAECSVRVRSLSVEQAYEYYKRVR